MSSYFKRRIYLLLVMLAIGSRVLAQPSRTILDRQTGSAIPNATIKVLHVPRGVIASEKGEFNLRIDNTDSVLFSSVGYHQIILTGDKIGTTIYLDPNSKELAVVVTDGKKIIRTILLGNKIEHFKNAESWGPSSTKIKEEFAQKIDLPDPSSVYKIKKIFIPVNKSVCWGSLIVHIYAPDSLYQIPGEELFIRSVTMDKRSIRQKQMTIDLTEENLYLRNDKHFFISIGWPEETYSGKCVTTIVFSRSSLEKTYSRQLAGNDYYWFPFGYFKDKFGVAYQAKTVYSVELDELK